MSKITVLDQNTIDKIAAGEVIERPASVVKELVENAIDAGATAITVDIKEGGTSFIRITDNGGGIHKDDVKLAFLRHSTSKIKSVEDLAGVSSLGFRGEALSSIAAVAQVELITKTAAGLTGIRYVIEGGFEKSMEEIGAPEGTTFIIRNLFYNTPVRRKFLKSPVTEAGYISDLMERLALSHPDISFKFINNGQIKLHTSGNTKLKDIIYNVYGREIASHLIPIDADMGVIKLEGYIGKPVVSRGNRNYENYYINGRYIKSGVVSKAIEDAYKSYMMQHKYPFTALHIKIDGEFLDVNVHPTKMELRFSNQEDVYKSICSAVSEGLARRELIPEVSLASGNRTKTQTGSTPKTSAPEPFEKNRLRQLCEMGERTRQQDAVRESKAYSSRPETVKSAAGSVRRQDDVVPVMGSVSAVEIPTADIRTAMAGKHPVANQNTPAPETRGMRAEKYEAENMQAAEQPEAENIQASEKPEAENIQKSEQTQADSGQAAESEIQVQETGLQEAASSGTQQLNLFDEKLLAKESRAEHRIIGQVFDTYWLVQFKDKLFIIDQHAAHEKVLFERTMNSLKKKEYSSQIISPPIILTLSMQEEELFRKHMDSFAAIGFETEHFGGKEYAVRAVPDNLFGIAQKNLLIEMIDGLSDGLASGSPDMVNEKIASMSCKAAVKGKQRISFSEAEALIDELLELENPYNCPHGRPTIISMSNYELEKKFKRIV